MKTYQVLSLQMKVDMDEGLLQTPEITGTRASQSDTVSSYSQDRKF